jgi:hippurate hydrolase
MNVIAEIAAQKSELTAWRKDIHAHPELAFEETRTAEFVEEQLRFYGYEVVSGVGGTGVVGSLTLGSSDKAIGIRADMDALPMDELNEFSHKSTHKGKMHGCGHDGHTVMALAAARYLAQTQEFDGTVRFIFQPAEEANKTGSGAQAMIKDGLFTRFPVDCVFAMHNAPGLKAGSMATKPGPIMASIDLFDVTVTGKGTHGAVPQSGIDPVLVASHMITAWQSIVSRNINPQEAAVISATSIVAGDSWNVIPQSAHIRGSIRALSPIIRAIVKKNFIRIAKDIASAFGAQVKVDFLNSMPVTVNDPVQTQKACEVAASLVGEENLVRDISPVMGSEDFSYMLEVKAGCYLFIGNSDANCTAPVSADEGGIFSGPGLENVLVASPCMLHDPHYDFNDDILPLGATFWVILAQDYLR